MDWQHVLDRAVAKAKAPGAVAFVGRHEKTLFHGASGFRQIIPEKKAADKDTLYDLASLTKVVATSTMVMLLRDEGKLDLDKPVFETLPVPGFQRFTPRHLITHTAGLPPFMPWYKEVHTVDEVLTRTGALDLSWAPGTRRRYSDLGFMILGKMVEILEADSLQGACQRRIFKPLDMKRTGFKPPEAWRKNCAATEKCAWRGRVMCGEVHDETSYAVGGVAGHAGLFSTAEDLAKFCRALLGGKLLKPETLEEMTRQTPEPHGWQGLAWKLDPWMDGSEGFLPARTAFGHTGFTGTSVCMDRATGYFVVLLSNTCHPSRDVRDTKTLRQVFHGVVSAEYYREGINTHTGLDRLVWDDFAPVADKKVALLTNQAAVDQFGRPAFEVLKNAAKTKLVRLYSPEHGYQGQAEAGASVRGETAAVPVTSLYGEQREPASAELCQADILVIDLPDIGARYYTYMATMKRCLHACAMAGVPALVLDRPNPLGGAVAEGPIAEVTGADTCCAAIPARHGMTLGEIALYFQQTEPWGKQLKLDVYLADDWWRECLHGQCALPWTPPSPNIPDADTALLYAGMCLFEGVNLNEGRGTETPFQIAGAPWLNAKAVLRALDRDACKGVEVTAATYTPRSIAGKASHPEYQDQECHGLRVTLRDREQARPFALAVALLCAMHKAHPRELQWKPAFDTLAGGSRLREAIESGAAPQDILQGAQAALDAFAQNRPARYRSREAYAAALLEPNPGQ